MSGAASSVSVVMATYNRVDLLPRAIASVLPQLRSVDELIVVDDGSEDGTPDLLASYGDRLRHARQENRGQSAARNRGLDMARGDYVSFIDDDDEYQPYHLDVLRTVLDGVPEIVYAYGNYVRIPRSGHVRRAALSVPGHLLSWVERQDDVRMFSELGSLPEGVEDFRVVIGHDYDVQMKLDYVIPGLVMIRRTLAGTRLRFTEALRLYEDWDLTSRLARDAPVAFLDVDVYTYQEPAGPRMMAQDSLELSAARLLVLNRVWGRDPEFQKEHAEAFQARCDREHLERARRLLTHGQPGLAGRDLARLSRPAPAYLRLLSALPASLLGTLMRIRRAIKRPPG